MKKYNRSQIILICVICAVIIAAAVTLCLIHKNSSEGSPAGDDVTANVGTADETSIGAVESETVSLNGGSVIIKYPALETDEHILPDEKSEMINALLRDTALQKLHDQYLEDENGEFTYDITDTFLYRSSEVISSVSKGRLHAESAAHDYVFAYSVNIDENTGELYSFSDIITDFDSFKKAFLAGKFSLSDGRMEVVDNLGWEYFMNQFNDEYGIYPDIYMDGDLIGIILEVPYAVGSTAFFTIEKSELAGALAQQFR